MTISERQLRRAAFWEDDWVCLDCGTSWRRGDQEDDLTCPECNSSNLVIPQDGVRVLEAVERDEGGRE